MEDEFNRVINAPPVVVSTARPDATTDFLNQRWCGYTGLTQEQAGSGVSLSAVHLEDPSEVLSRWRLILELTEPGDLEARLRRADGAYHLRATPNDGPGATFSFSLSCATEESNLGSIRKAALTNVQSVSRDL